MTTRRQLLALVGVVAAAASATWLTAERFRSADGPVRRPIANDSVVMLGNSITAGGNWEVLLPSHPLVNQGFAGFTTAELLPIAVEVAAAVPAVVFVLTGTNDVRDGLPPFRTESDLASILDVFAEAAPLTRVVVQTVLPRASRSSEIAETNEAIVALATERGIEMLDLHAEFDNGAGGLRPEETIDGWHLSDAGYERWAGLVEADLAAQT